MKFILWKSNILLVALSFITHFHTTRILVFLTGYLLDLILFYSNQSVIIVGSKSFTFQRILCNLAYLVCFILCRSHVYCTWLSKMCFLYVSTVHKIQPASFIFVFYLLYFIVYVAMQGFLLRNLIQLNSLFICFLC